MHDQQEGLVPYEAPIETASATTSSDNQGSWGVALGIAVASIAAISLLFSALLGLGTLVVEETLDYYEGEPTPFTDEEWEEWEEYWDDQYYEDEGYVQHVEGYDFLDEELYRILTEGQGQGASSQA